MTACTARGGGSLPPATDITGNFQSTATFGFTLTCGIKKGKAVVRGQLSYHDHGPSTIFDEAGLLIGTFSEVALHGTLDPIITSATTCEANDVSAVFSGTAQFVGRYTPQTLDPTIPNRVERGTFNVLVFDQGEPGRSQGDITGDGFSIELFGGRYNGYTRGGYIEGGNVQVKE
jgi:hypothetical protein